MNMILVNLYSTLAILQKAAKSLRTPLFRCDSISAISCDLEILQSYDVLNLVYMNRTLECISNSDGSFQENNVQPHKSKQAKNFHAENDLHVLSWSAQSPDFNLIKNM